MVIAPNNSDRASVWEASEQAQAMGVNVGMPVAVARRLVKGLAVVDPRPDLYKNINSDLMHFISSFTPLYECDELGKFYLDLTGFSKLYGPTQDFSHRLLSHINQKFSLTPFIGGAINKLVSKVASVNGEESIQLVSEGTEPQFLGPLPVETLPLAQQIKELTPKNKDDIFTDLNIKTIKDLSLLDHNALRIAFYEYAKPLAQMARGVDHTPVYPPDLGPLVHHNTTFDPEINEPSILRFELRKLVDQTSQELRAQNAFPGKAKLELRYGDYKFVERTIQLKQLAHYPKDLFPPLRNLFNQLYTRRSRLKYMALTFSQLHFSGIQLSLFEHKEKKLVDTLDQIKQKFGEHLMERGGL